MKSEKLSLKGIKNVLSRAELKKIMAGSGGPTCTQCYNETATCCECIYSNGPSGFYLLTSPGLCVSACQSLNYYSGILGNACSHCGC